MNRSQRQLIGIYLLTALLGCVVFWFAIRTGGIQVSVKELLRGLFVAYDENVAIIFQLRFPRILVALLGGALMSLSGVYMQAVLRNPLADPGIIGVSSGAAFAALFVTSFFPALAVFTPLFSFAGGMLAFVLVYVLAWRRELQAVRLILTGVAVDALFTGLYEALNSFSGASYTGAASIAAAGIALKTWEHVTALAVCTVLALLLCLFAAGKCNLLAFSDQTMVGLGVNVRRVRFAVAVLSVFLASIFTAFVGKVGFLGLIVPHLARLLVGSDHKKLLPYSALLGAVVFLLADTVGRSIAYPYEISPAIVMSVVGGPMLIFLLRRSESIYGT